MGALRVLLVGSLGSLMAMVASCGATQQGTAGAGLRVIADPPEARVYVDDRFIASARRLAARPEALRTGVHHVTITAEGYFPHDVEVELDRGVTTIEIELRRIPP